MKRMTRVTFLLVAAALAGGAVVVGCCFWPVNCDDNTAGPEHPWAQPIDKPGVETLYRVSDTLYRGAQPDAKGMAELKAMGVKTIVNLRMFHSDDEEIGDLDLVGVHIGTTVFHVSEDAVVEFLKVVADPARQPVFVHCQQGVDRTGAMVAIYRIVIEGWTKAEALDEMVNGGFGHHKILVNLPRFVNGLDIPDIKRRAGLDK